MGKMCISKEKILNHVRGLALSKRINLVHLAMIHSEIHNYLQTYSHINLNELITSDNLFYLHVVKMFFEAFLIEGPNNLRVFYHPVFDFFVTKSKLNLIKQLFGRIISDSCYFLLQNR